MPDNLPAELRSVVGIITLLATCFGYATIALILLHAGIGGWSGVASLAAFATTLMATPFLAYRGWVLRRLWSSGTAYRLVRLAILVVPLVVISVWGFALALWSDA